MRRIIRRGELLDYFMQCLRHGGEVGGHARSEVRSRRSVLGGKILLGDVLRRQFYGGRNRRGKPERVHRQPERVVGGRGVRKCLLLRVEVVPEEDLRARAR